MTYFRNRVDAGRQLAAQVCERGLSSNSLVLALPRGGVPVAHEVAKALGAPLDVFIVRKLGVPGHEELAMGAIASGGVRVMNDEVLRYASATPEAIEAVAKRETEELARRERHYRGTKPALDVAGKTVIVVDDGLATGSTMRAAVRALRQMNAGRIVVAVPVGAVDSCRSFQHEAEDVICLHTPQPFEAVGLWYGDFSQTSDEEVMELLDA